MLNIKKLLTKLVNAIGTTNGRSVIADNFFSGNPLSITIPNANNCAALLYGYIQGVTAAGVFLIVSINGTVTITNVVNGQTISSIVTATCSNYTLTVRTTNAAPSRVTLTCL